MIREIGQYLKEVQSGIKTKGSFIQDLTVTFSGNALSQALGFLLTPVIARIYGPASYGLFALFIAITNTLSALSTLQYPSGFVAAKDDGEFYRIVRITLIVLVGFVLLSFIVLGFYDQEILEIFHVEELAPYVLLIPVYQFFMGMDYLLQGWNIRLKEFKRGALSKIFSTVLSKGVAIGWGLLVAPSAMGMIIGNLIVYPFESLIKLSQSVKQGISELFKPNTWTEWRSTLHAFRAYPLYITPGIIISNLSNQLPVYYFSMAFNQTLVGFFALANSIVSMPLYIIINSSTTVFLQKAAEVKLTAPERLKDLVKRLYQRLFVISFIPLAAFAFLSDWVFVLLFGKDWQQAGVFSAFLAISAIFSVAALPLSVLFRLLNHERTNLIINIVFVVIKFGALWWGIHNEDIVFSIIGYSLATMLSYIVYLLFVFRMVRLSAWSLLRDTVIVGALFIIILWIKL
jgi:O-antigen/teichoic acid export membrane protein